MSTMLDYLYWRGDLSLKKEPLNELDGLVLTRFAYLPFELVKWEKEETVGSLVTKVEALPEGALRLEEDARLNHALKKAARYKDMKVTDFVKDNNEDAVKQFCALTVHLDDESMYIAFCGTDATLLGWKEDFYMSFMQDVPAQQSALRYVEQQAEKYPEKKFYVGGHSKGGNLAVYAAVNLPEPLKERLLHVSNYDGPGFPKSFIESHDFSSVLERIATFIPQESVFGRIHDHAEGFSVVNSTERGLFQHNVYSWEVKPQKMNLLPEADTSSDVMYAAIQNMLENTEPDQRKEFVDEVYNIFTSANFSSVKELHKPEISQVIELGKAVGDLNEAHRQEAKEMNEAMFKSLLEAVTSTMEERLTQKLSLKHLLDKLPERE